MDWVALQADDDQGGVVCDAFGGDQVVGGDPARQGARGAGPGVRESLRPGSEDGENVTITLVSMPAGRTERYAQIRRQLNQACPALLAVHPVQHGADLPGHARGEGDAVVQATSSARPFSTVTTASKPPNRTSTV